MNVDIKQKWIDALRSGKYKQGFGALHTGDECFCVFGILCELGVEAGICNRHSTMYRGGVRYSYSAVEDDYNERFSHAPPNAVLAWIDLEDGIWRDLAARNDQGVDFYELSQMIEGMK